MKILFDQVTPVPIRKYLAEHVVRTAYQQGWDTLENGQLIAMAEQQGFDLILTCDQNIEYQQNLSNRSISIVVLTSNNWSKIKHHIERIVDAVNTSAVGSYTKVTI